MSVNLWECSDSEFKQRQIKLAFFDLDGTIVVSGQKISDVVLAELKRLHATGVKIAIASGRPYFAAKLLAETMKISAPSVFFSGALVIDPTQGDALLEHFLEETISARLIDFARKRKLYCEFYSSTDFFVDKHSQFTAIHACYIQRTPQETELEHTLRNHRVLKAGIMLPKSELKKVCDDLTDTFPELNLGIGYGADHPEIGFINITSPRASRESAFNFITGKLGVAPEEVFAIGDGESDIPFLTLAGTGVAMGSAPQSVKNAANFVTKDVSADGAAFALKKLIR